MATTWLHPKLQLIRHVAKKKRHQVVSLLADTNNDWVIVDSVIQDASLEEASSRLFIDPKSFQLFVIEQSTLSVKGKSNV